MFFCDDDIVLGNQIRQNAISLLQWVYLFLTVCKIALLALKGYYTELQLGLNMNLSGLSIVLDQFEHFMSTPQQCEIC